MAPAASDAEVMPQVRCGYADKLTEPLNLNKVVSRDYLLALFLIYLHTNDHSTFFNELCHPPTLASCSTRVLFLPDDPALLLDESWSAEIMKKSLSRLYWGKPENKRPKDKSSCFSKKRKKERKSFSVQIDAEWGRNPTSEGIFIFGGPFLMSKMGTTIVADEGKKQKPVLTAY